MILDKMPALNPAIRIVRREGRVIVVPNNSAANN